VTAARAGKSALRSFDLVDRHHNRIAASRASMLADDLAGPARFAALGGPALVEALHAAPPDRPVPMFLALPDASRVDQRRAGFEGDVLERLAAASGGRVQAVDARVYRADNAGFALALSGALDALAHGDAHALVGGVDSYVDEEVLRALDDERRLYSTKGDGIHAGEGAAFALVSRAATPDAYAAIVDVSTAEESMDDDAPSLASAMTRALRSAAAASPGGRVAWLLSDFNGEDHRASEWSKVTIRLAEELGEAEADRFVESTGDVGAATGALLLTIACRLTSARARPHGSATIALSSEGSTRAAVTVSFGGPR
jgi:3-oxoacyl-[acyl-carrier-protein] synthase-1